MPNTLLKAFLLKIQKVGSDSCIMEDSI